MDDMNDPRLLAQGFRFYEHLKIMVDMNKSGSWAQRSRYYEQLRVVDKMVDF